MKPFLKYLLIILPFTTLLAKANCIVNVKIEGPSLAGIATIKLHNKTDTVVFNNSAFKLIEDTESPQLTKINIKYKALSRVDEVAIYLVEGMTNISLSPPDSTLRITLTGPQLAVDYQDKLRWPVYIYNSEISQIKSRRLAEKNKSQPDSLIINRLSTQLAAKIKQCFNVPKSYIKDHSDSPLSLIALSMMGNGSKGNPVSATELNQMFNSLTEDIKNSVEGLNYARKLAGFQSAQH